MPDLSVLIPSRQEQFLNRTIREVLDNAQADTDLIVVLDGSWPVEPIPDDERVTIIHFSKVIGQRAATNAAARVSQSPFLMKLDAHCKLSPGYDRELLAQMEPGSVLVPTMYNLHAWDWGCNQCGWSEYQGQEPDGCCKCNGKMRMKIVWREKRNPETTAMRFDRDLRFGYWREYKDRQGDGAVVESMSLLGACWMVSREDYHAWDICDERHGGWGQQGTEVACKAWLSGGKVLVSRKAWFAHLFRTFGFPYDITGVEQEGARAHSHWLWNPDGWPRWERAVHDVRWLVDRFSPVPGWED